MKSSGAVRSTGSPGDSRNSPGHYLSDLGIAGAVIASNMTSFVAELVGTMLLIVLGDGVVAKVLPARCKGQNAGWNVITGGGPLP